ncbi:MAG: adenylate/guanylate cyclase domain-containing protein [Fluviibacter sp.]
MISSKDLLEQSGISRATLNNYIQLGLLPKPEVKSIAQKNSSGPRLLGYFPLAALERIDEIRQLKREGLSMDDIVQFLAGKAMDDTVATEVTEKAAESLSGVQNQPTARRSAVSDTFTESKKAVKSLRQEAFSMPLTLDGMAQPAYMLNYNLELVWYNEAARTKLFGFGSLPDQSKDRSLFKLLSRPEAKLSLQNQRAIALMNLRFALVRVGSSALELLLREADPELLPVLQSIESVSPDPQQAIAETVLQTYGDGDDGSIQQAYAVYFREGILIALSPHAERQDELLDFLSRRDRVIEGLLRKRLPVLTPLAVLVADLQHSVRICSELPPDEYFELINEIWSTMAPILRKYSGTYGKHVGDGMVYYFFPQPESNYLFNALVCASELREAMRKINADWQFKKRWFTELQLNIGLHEGQEWLGTFQTVNRVEFVVLGDTINYASRLSDFARHGSIWATKNLVSKLTPDERSRVEFGVLRQSQEYGDRFIPASYAQVDSLIAGEQSRNDKLQDIAHLAVTEIRRIGLTRNY